MEGSEGEVVSTARQGRVSCRERIHSRSMLDERSMYPSFCHARRHINPMHSCMLAAPRAIVERIPLSLDPLRDSTLSLQRNQLLVVGASISGERSFLARVPSVCPTYRWWEEGRESDCNRGITSAEARDAGIIPSPGSPFYPRRILCFHPDIDTLREKQAISIFVPSSGTFASLASVHELEIYRARAWRRGGIRNMNDYGVYLGGGSVAL